jgi:hypothetical protein
MLSARCEGAQRPRAENVGGAGRAAACVDAGGPYAAEGFQVKCAQRTTPRRPEVGGRWLVGVRGPRCSGADRKGGVFGLEGLSERMIGA